MIQVISLPLLHMSTLLQQPGLPTQKGHLVLNVYLEEPDVISKVQHLLKALIYIEMLFIMEINLLLNLSRDLNHLIRKTYGPGWMV